MNRGITVFIQDPIFHILMCSVTDEHPILLSAAWSIFIQFLFIRIQMGCNNAECILKLDTGT
jgi:hypothetical protein